MKSSKRVHQLAAAVTLAASSSALAQIRVASYNIEADVNGNTAPNPGLDTVLQAIGNESVNGFARPLDIIGLEETTSNSATVAPIVTSLNSFYGPDTYAMSTYQATEIGNNPTTGNGPNALIYNKKTLTLVASIGFGTLSGSEMSRQEVRYQFRPIAYGTNTSADFYVYVGHYKAMGTASDMTRRNVEAQTVRANAAALPPGSRIIYTGDLNLTGGSSEDAWTTLVAPGTGTDPGQAIDPINLGNGSWANSQTAFRGAYSDSTTSLGSRLDFQLNTAATMDGRGFSYIGGSYHVFGNDGSTHTGQAATSTFNTALTGVANRSAILSSITTASDHYPLIADYRLPANMGVSVASVPAQVIVGASLPVGVTVTNTAPVQVAIGADGLDYSLVSTGSLAGSASVTGLLALAAGNTHNLVMNTATVGVKSGTISVNSTNQEILSGSFSQGVSTTVLAHAHPSFDLTGSMTIDFGTRAANSQALGLGAASTSFAVRNLADASGFSSRLDLDSVAGGGDTSVLTTNLSPFANLAAGGAQNFVASMSTANFGSFSATYTMNLSDENIPGAQATAPLMLTITGRIAMAGDANIDGVVNALDFNALATHFGQSSQTWSGADFSADGLVNTIDFNALASNFGDSYNANPAPSLGALIPEPASFAVSCLGFFILRRRNRHNPLIRLD